MIFIFTAISLSVIIKTVGLKKFSLFSEPVSNNSLTSVLFFSLNLSNLSSSIVCIFAWSCFISIAKIWSLLNVLSAYLHFDFYMFHPSCKFKNC